jgi:hypothetical protein
MVLVAPLLPRRFALPSALAEVAAKEWAELDELVRLARERQPAEASPEETTILERLVRAAVAIGEALGKQGLSVFREGLQQAASELLNLEFNTTETERKLALRHLQTAVNKYGDALETIVVALAALTPAELRTLMAADTSDSTLTQAVGDAELTAFLRWQLEIMVAFDTLGASVEEFAYWSQRAVVNSRRVTAWLSSGRLFHGLRGEIARIRARHPWDNWDDDEFRREFQPWPTRSDPSR